MIAVPEQLRIGRLRLGVRGDTLAGGQRVRRALDNAQLSPRSLSPRAILCVRRFATRLSIGARDPPPRALAAWSERTRDALERLARRAARPALEQVPADAQAVVFADEAEWLACLARDVLSGSAASRWWWKAFAPHGVTMQAAARAWCARVAAAPEALARLAATGDAVCFVDALDPASVRALAQALCRHVGAGSVALPSDIATAVTSPRAQSDPPRTQWPGSTRAPWAVLAPEAQDRRLAPLRALVAGVALSYARAPHIVATADFAHALRAWTIEACASPTVESSSDRSTVATPLPDAPHELHAPMQQETSVVVPPNARLARRGSVALHARYDNAPSDEPTRRWYGGASPIGTVSPLAASVDSVGTTSECAGVFYLVNVGVALGFYADAFHPAAANIALPLWDFLRAIGKPIAGRALARDPLWNVLRELIGGAPGELRSQGRPFPIGAWRRASMPRVRAYLRDALAMRRGAAPFVCRQPGRIVVTATHVDVHFALARLPIALRIAGLDRDPGWIPAAGRAIAFHFD